MLIDSHAHLSSLDVELSPLLKRAQDVGIEAIVNICTTPEEFKKGENFPNWIYHVGATTPHDVVKFGDAHFQTFANHAKEGKFVAIGETGLDYHYYRESAPLQQEFLRRYLQLAHTCHLPVVIHCREAFSDLFRILDEEEFVPGVLHCFTGTLEEAKAVIERDWYLSLSGIATFKKSDVLREVAKIAPLNRLLIETDTPYLAPHPHRGKPNEPSYLIETAKCLAQARGVLLEELAAATRQNAIDLFRLGIS